MNFFLFFHTIKNTLPQRVRHISSIVAQIHLSKLTKDHCESRPGVWWVSYTLAWEKSTYVLYTGRESEEKKEKRSRERK